MHNIHVYYIYSYSTNLQLRYILCTVLYCTFTVQSEYCSLYLLNLTYS